LVPVEDGDVVEGEALLLGQPVDLADDRQRLLLLVVDLPQHHLFAGAGVGPELLFGALRDPLDDGVGGVEDVLGGAIVLLQLHDRGLGEVALEAQDVADVGAAEAVDRLVVVADDAEVAVLLREQPG